MDKAEIKAAMIRLYSFLLGFRGFGIELDLPGFLSKALADLETYAHVFYHYGYGILWVEGPMAQDHKLHARTENLAKELPYQFWERLIRICDPDEWRDIDWRAQLLIVYCEGLVGGKLSDAAYNRIMQLEDTKALELHLRQFKAVPLLNGVNIHISLRDKGMSIHSSDERVQLELTYIFSAMGDMRR